MHYGAGLLIVRPEDDAVLLARRSVYVSLPGMWGIPGGGVEAGETYLEAALREATEELGSIPRMRIYSVPFVYKKPGLSYSTFLAVMANGKMDWEPVLNEESDAWGYFEVLSLPVPMVPGALKAIEGLVGMARSIR